MLVKEKYPIDIIRIYSISVHRANGTLIGTVKIHGFEAYRRFIEKARAHGYKVSYGV